MKEAEFSSGHTERRHSEPSGRIPNPSGAWRRFSGGALFWLSVMLAVTGQLLIRWSSAAAAGVWLGSLLCMAVSAWCVPTGHGQKTYRGLELKWRDAVHFGPGVLVILLACLGQWQRWSPWLVFFLWLAGCMLLLCPWFEAFQARKEKKRWVNGIRPSFRFQSSHALMLLVAAACLWGYMWGLKEYPRSIHGDEADVGVYARELIQNEPFDFFNVSWAHIPRLFFYIPGVFQWVVGNDLLGLRLSTAVCGLGGLLLTGLWVRLLFGGRTAWLAVVLLAMNHFYFHLSRLGASYIQANFFTALILYLLTRGLCKGRWRSLVLAGMALAVAIMSYYSTRLIPFQIFATYVLLAVWVRKFWARGFMAFAVVALAFLLAAGPLFVYFTQNPTAFLGRANVVSVFSPDVQRHMQASFPGQSWQEIAWMKITRTAWIFHSQGDTSLQYGYKGSGMLEEVTGVLLIIGLGVALANWKRPRFLWPILWGLMTMVTGGILTVNTPFYPRMAVLPIFAITVCAYGFNEVLRRMERIRLPALRWLWVVLLGVVVAFSGRRNYEHYFVGYHQIQYPRTALTTLVYRLQQVPQETEVLMFGLPNLGLGYAPFRLMIPEMNGRDVRMPEAFFSKKQPVEGDQLWIFITGRNLEYADRALELYPGGRMEEIRHRNALYCKLYWLSASSDEDSGQAVEP